MNGVPVIAVFAPADRGEPIALESPESFAEAPALGLSWRRRHRWAAGRPARPAAPLHMSLALRDQEAFDLVNARAFDAAYVVSLDLEMQARRLTVELYGTLHRGQSATYRARITFFGTSALAIENDAGAFPESVGTSSLALSYVDETDEGAAELRGRQPWALLWNYDGLAYEEAPAVLVSLADDL